MKVALVTGASRGLGAEIARALAGEDWTVAVNYAHDDKGAEDVVVAIRKNGGRALAAKFDVTEATAVRAGVNLIAETVKGY